MFGARFGVTSFVVPARGHGDESWFRRSHFAGSESPSTIASLAHGSKDKPGPRGGGEATRRAFWLLNGSSAEVGAAREGRRAPACAKWGFDLLRSGA